ncbi:hypothetical protein HY36_15490 [Hyphomonas atlantica]|uniref:Uncharacterized protein n=1 Tax=Hyphomonas atlantica TaxID=1280948 RepID=A0A059E490_9PROT|nr:hypothetical protein HY36_15490 [Hyphomonas atlantica]|tara:strand:+ start:151 stop:315 length:165 start_codon:yes stop_codon:yes gene_type:complete
MHLAVQPDEGIDTNEQPKLHIEKHINYYPKRGALLPKFKLIHCFLPDDARMIIC